MRRRKGSLVGFLLVLAVLGALAAVVAVHMDTIRVLVAPQTVEMKPEEDVVSRVKDGGYKDVSFDEDKKLLSYRTEDEAVSVSVSFQEDKVRKITGQVDPSKVTIQDVSQGVAYVEDILEPYLSDAEIDALKLRMAAEAGQLAGMAGQSELDFQTSFGQYDIAVTGSIEAPAFEVIAR